MVKRHLLRLAAPKTWPVARKLIRFIARPKPGAHSFASGIPLSVALKDMLKLAKTAKELKYLLNNRNIMVDGKRIMGKNFQIGLMDVLSIPDIGKNYRILLNRQNRIYAKEIDANESKYKLCKITGKTAVKGSRIQLNLHDAKSVITKDKVSVGDTLVFEFGKGVTGKLEYKEGALVYLTAGKHVGKFGKIVKTIETKRRRDWVVIRSNDTELTTAKRYAFVVGDDTPRISLD